MEYCLPHAVLALLQEENSPNSPKSYFISSSTKSTKITLIYTRRKRESEQTTARKSRNRRVAGSCSSSGTDDYKRRPSSAPTRDYVGSQNGGHTTRICASTPGRGYNDAARVRGESGRRLGGAKMPTDPLNRSPSKEHAALSHFASFNTGNPGSDSDVSNHYSPLSPFSLAEDRPPTPGKNFFPLSSPRPPTPSLGNHSPQSGINHGDPSLVNRHSNEYYDREISLPPTPRIPYPFKDKDSVRHSKSKSKVDTGHLSNSGSRSHTVTQSSKTTLPSIKVHNASPATPPKHSNNLSDLMQTGKKPLYHRIQSWDGPNHY